MDLHQALEEFDRTEANLQKLEKLWAAYAHADPGSVHFGLDTPEMDQVRRDWQSFVESLPEIDGFRPVPELMTLDELAQNRLDALEVGFIEAATRIENLASQPGRDLAEFRHRLHSSRRALTRAMLDETMHEVDAMLRATHQTAEGLGFEDASTNGWTQLATRWDRIHRLLGSDRPAGGRWADMARHIRFAEPHDLRDIIDADWPSVRQAILDATFADEPLTVRVADLATLVSTSPSGPVTTAVDWSVLDPDGFERVVLEILRSSSSYENSERLMSTNASDKGRDLSTVRVVVDELSGTQRIPTMVQCKHYQSTSVNLNECLQTVEQAKLWNDAGFRVVVIATSGNLTQQAVEWVEARRTSGEFPSVEVWNQAQLEHMLAARPKIRTAFAL